MSQRPWMKFYPNDWQADPQLGSCSASARGIWMEMLCLMHRAQPYGYLLVNGSSPTEQALSLICRVGQRELKAAISELRAAGVFDETSDGTILSRRMVRDAQKEASNRENGRKGGNPKLKLLVNQSATDGLTPDISKGDKAQWPLASPTKREQTSQDRHSRAGGYDETAPFTSGGRS
jgi:hypothetical protein